MSQLTDQLASLRIERDAPRRRRRFWIALVCVLIGVVAGGAAWRARSALGRVEVRTVRPTVTVTGPSGGAPVLTASGYVVARRQAVVSAKIQGRLAELRVEEGSRVRRGDVLARLENDDYEAQVARAQAQLGSAAARINLAAAALARADAELAEQRRQLGVAENLAREQVLPIDQLDAARSRVKLAQAAVGQATADQDQARAELERAKADLSFNEALLRNTVIRAPFDGTVVRKMAEVGESVAPIPPGVNLSVSSGAIVALADLATLEVEADIGESNVARLREGQPAEVVVEAFSDRAYQAVLRQIIPTADRTKATVQVKVTIVNRDEDLKPEMTARVTFLEPSKSGTAANQPPRPLITVPREVLATRDGTTQVFEVVDDRVRARRVIVGSTERATALIEQGLSGSEVLVVGPEDTLKEGDRVRVREN